MRPIYNAHRDLADGRHVGQPFALAVEKPLSAQVQVAQRNDLHTFAMLPQRSLLNICPDRKVPAFAEKLRA